MRERSALWNEGDDPVKPNHKRLLEDARDLDRADRREEALLAYRRFLAVEPRDAGGWADYGGLLLVSGQLQPAEEACKRALQIERGHPSALLNLGCALMQLDHLQEAEGYMRQVLAKDPQRMDARLALVDCLIRRAELEPAQKLLVKAIAQEPGNPSAHQFLGHIFHRLGRWPELQAEIERYLRIDPESTYLEYERGFLDLLFGDLSRGWQRYEARFKVPGLVAPTRQFTQPRWEGQPFAGQTLLLHYEQGFGDTIMFVRFTPQVKALGGRVLLAAQASLAELVATCPGVDEVIPHGLPLPPFDLQLPLLSLPLVLHATLDTIPAEIPYLNLPARIPNREPIAEVLAASEGKTRVGLVWAGSSIHKNDRVRSLPTEALVPLGVLPNVAWYSFQLGMTVEAPLPGIVSLAPLLSNFSDTAYALSGMDLVITVDTVLAHLAGALGIPTLLVIPYSPDWRWLLDREDSPWYPTMRIYRQPEPGDWQGVIQKLVGDLMDA